MNRARLLPASAIVAAGLFALPAFGGELACRVASADHLLWVHSGEWEGGRLVLGDVGAGELAVFDLQTAHWSRVSYPGQGPLEFTKPEIFPSPANGVLVSAVTRLVRLDESLRPVEGPPLSAASDDGFEVTMDGAVVTSEGQVLGLASVWPKPSQARDSSGPKSDPWLGVGLLSLKPTIRIQQVRALSPESTELDLYDSRAAPFGTSLGGRAFWLTLAPEAFVTEVTPGGNRRLDLVPLEWRAAPAFPKGHGASTLRADNAAREKLPFLAGLVAQGKELFIVHHEVDQGGPRWRLAAIEPDKPGKFRLLTLPTRSNWVTVIPGPDYWAILEQGAVLGPATQSTRSVLLVPSAWFSAEVSPLALPGAEQACAKAR